MKNLTYLIAALSIFLSSGAFAQGDTNQATAIACGGGAVSSGDYAGNVTIGLPFVGLTTDGSGDTARLGMYYDIYRDTVINIYPKAIDFGSISAGHDSTTFFTVKNASQGEVSSIPIDVGAPSDTAFSITSGSGSDNLFTGDSIKIYVRFMSNDKAHAGVIPVTYPGKKDSVSLIAALSGVGEAVGYSQIEKVYPNPSTGGFSIVPPDGAGEISRIDLLDEAGQVVADLTHSAVSDADGIHVKSSGLAAGTYFVRVVTHRGEYVYNIVIDKAAH